jgi:hypothetical protein
LLFHRYFIDISGILHWYFIDISLIFHWYFIDQWNEPKWVFLAWFLFSISWFWMNSELIRSWIRQIDSINTIIQKSISQYSFQPFSRGQQCCSHIHQDSTGKDS